MKEAFTYMFKDNKFMQKALTYLGMVFVANIAIMFSKMFAPGCQNCTPEPKYYLCAILGALLMIIPQGYVVSCIKSFIDQKENIVIPFLNLKKNFVDGFKYCLSILILSLVFGLSMGVMTLVIAIIASITGLKFLIVILGLVFFVLLILLMFYTVAFIWIFANKCWVTSFLKWKKAVELVSKNKKSYWMAFGFLLAIGIVTGLISALLPAANVVSVIVSAFIMALITSYTMFAWTYIAAKSIKPECIELL